MSIRVFIADDHGILRGGLRALITLQPDMEVVGEAANGPDAEIGVKATEPDVVLMDITMPNGGGLAAIAAVKQVRPKTRKFQSWNSRIQGKHLDFVVCDIETLDVKLAIELEDATGPADRGRRDRFINTALAAAGVPLLRVRVQEKYETAVLRKDLEDVMGIVRKKKRA